MSPRRVAGWVSVLAAFLALLWAGYYLRDYVREDQELEAFLESKPQFASSKDRLALVERLVEHIGALPDKETTARMGYSNPFYRTLRARPLDVLQHGGFCGNKGRLLVTLLRIRRIPARVAYLYNELGLSQPKIGQPYVTAFVEVEIDGRWVVADPLLGIVFRDAGGRPATARDLALTPALVTSQAPRWYSPEVFDYHEIRGIRWSKFPGGERLGDVLAELTSREWVNSLHYPSWAHRPNLLLSAGGGVLITLFLGLAAWLLRGARACRSMGGQTTRHLRSTSDPASFTNT